MKKVLLDFSNKVEVASDNQMAFGLKSSKYNRRLLEAQSAKL